MAGHDSLLPGINGRKITAVPIFVDKKDKVTIDKKKFSLNKIEKKNFEEERKLVNSNRSLMFKGKMPRLPNQ